MSKRLRYRAVLFLGTVGLMVTGVFKLWLWSYRRQEALNRQLIAALVKSDTHKALLLVERGADPKTRFYPSKPSLRQMWDRMLHRAMWVHRDNPSAFHMACGAHWQGKDTDSFCYLHEDAAALVEVMLQHGDEKDSYEEDGCMPLTWSVIRDHRKTINILLQRGVDVNEQDKDGTTALLYAVGSTGVEEYPVQDGLAIIRQLHAHGADPNRACTDGILQYVQGPREADIKALLKQTGAKK